MIRVCCQCGKCIGEKLPYENKAVTHGICNKCYKKAMKKLEEEKDGKNKSNKPI